MLREAERLYNGGREFIRVGKEKKLAIRPRTSATHIPYPNKVLHTKVPYDSIKGKGKYLEWGEQYYWAPGGGAKSNPKAPKPDASKGSAPKSSPPPSSPPKSSPPKSGPPAKT